MASMSGMRTDRSYSNTSPAKAARTTKGRQSLAPQDERKVIETNLNDGLPARGLRELYSSNQGGEFL
jgi:hypothetical protein